METYSAVPRIGEFTSPEIKVIKLKANYKRYGDVFEKMGSGLSVED
ncbi:MAG: hypothetical protein ACFFGZ_19880 [Candidatus Thorarchaeota archaeon]